MDDPWARQTEGRVGDLKRRVPILIRLIADCDHLGGDLDSEVRNEEHRVKIHDPAHPAYSIYARATALRRDNLRRSTNELRAHLAEAKKALHELGETTTDAWSTALLELA
jgi:flagellar protein FliJ